MHKQRKPRKLKLATETVHTLKPAELVAVNGGGTVHCDHPTTTVLPTGPC